MQRKFDLLVFDWDGTLMDTVERITQCTQLCFDRLGMPKPEVSAVKSQIGKSLPLFMELLLMEPNDVLVQKLCSAYRDISRSGILPEMKAFPGIENMLEELKSKDYQLAIATGKSRRGLDRDLEICGLGSFFKASRCADESVSKPDPAMLHWLCSFCRMPPNRVMVIGDTTHDLEMAARAGVKSAGVLCGCHSAEQLVEYSPLVLLEQTADLASWLEL